MISRCHGAIAVFLVSACVLTGAVPGFAQARNDPLLVIELWTELDPLVADGGERPVPREVAVGRMLDEAVFVFSGMVYGFRFSYVPADPARRVLEEFTLEPYALIIRGDPRLDVLQTWVTGDRLYARLMYTVDERQASWYRSWQSAATATSSGTGAAPFTGGPAVKQDALHDAIRMAIRNHARMLELNRPRRITGAAMIADAPVIGIRSGHYEARLPLLLQIDSIERYTNY